MSSLHSPLLLSRWQVSPELTVGPLCVWFGEIVPAPHYGVSHRLSTIRCPVKSTPLQPNNLQRLLLSLALQLPSCLCELYAAFCSPSCALLGEASTTTTAAMTKGSICGRIGAILHRGLHGFQPLTAWLAGETVGVDRDLRGRIGQKGPAWVSGWVFVRGMLSVQSESERKRNGGRRMRRKRSSFDSQCYCSMMMQSTLSRSLVTLDRRELDQSLQHGSGRQERKQGGC